MVKIKVWIDKILYLTIMGYTPILPTLRSITIITLILNRNIRICIEYKIE